MILIFVLNETSLIFESYCSSKGKVVTITISLRLFLDLSCKRAWIIKYLHNHYAHSKDAGMHPGICP